MRDLFWGVIDRRIPNDSSIGNTKSKHTNYQLLYDAGTFFFSLTLLISVIDLLISISRMDGWMDGWMHYCPLGTRYVLGRIYNLLLHCANNKVTKLNSSGLFSFSPNPLRHFFHDCLVDAMYIK